jgi:3-methyladenine DNA glycosylase AlkC
MDLYWVCNASGESHYRHILNAMVESEDFRDAELLIPLLLRSPEPSDFDILTRLASTQTPMVAAMASEALNVCAPHWEKQRVKP